MKGRTIPKLFFVIWFILFIIILCLSMFSVDEDVPGWEYNISRKLNDYIHNEVETASLIPSDFCDNPSFLVIICISSPQDFEVRQTIRKTWGKEKVVKGHNVSLYFLLGQTTDLDLQKNITEEYLQFRDVVQEQFHDKYNNLTIKSTMMLKLFTWKCQNSSSYLLKIDDDMYLNIPKLINELLTKNQTENLLMGSVICNSKPIRTSKDKWYAGPSYMFPNNTYPTYISGTSYCMSGDVAQKLLKVALATPIFHLEDVYLTGICAKKIGLKLTHNGRFTYHEMKPNYCLYKQLITVHNQDPNSIQKIYNSSHDVEMDKRCQREENMFFVRKWLMENVILVSKNRRRRHCP
ncbi:hypothetical protein ABEB36_003325 [Hypothenemus hampei]|uniref:Hexosyltransferase n=1 Tax=Hypothenemus hampei TaxID=57062 RepID=A0ABD1FAL4_HYPHA